MWLFRIIKFVFRWRLRMQGPQGRLIRLAGSHLVERILKSSQSNAESHSDITEGVAPGNGRQANRVYTDAILSKKRGVRIGLFLLGILVFLSLLVLVPVLWAIWLVGTRWRQMTCCQPSVLPFTCTVPIDPQRRCGHVGTIWTKGWRNGEQDAMENPSVPSPCAQLISLRII